MSDDKSVVPGEVAESGLTRRPAKAEAPFGGPEGSNPSLTARPVRALRRGIDSYAVTRDGLDGKREHWMPGNVRRGTGPREKRSFDSEQDALNALGNKPGGVYQCSICEKWHRASEAKA